MRSPGTQIRAAVTAAAVAACCVGVFVSSGPLAARATGTTSLVLQQMDSCKQALGGAAYELTGSGVDIQGSEPSQTKQLVSQSSTCPLQQGDCTHVSVGCITLSGVPSPGTYRIHEIRTPDADQSNPEGYAACNGGSACRSQVVDVSISASGGVQATVTNVYPDGVSVTYPTAAQHSGSSFYAGTAADPIVVHNFGLAPPSSNPALQCDGDSDADDHLTGTPSSHCAYPESEESSACQPYPWSCTLQVTGSSGDGDSSSGGSSSGTQTVTGGGAAAFVNRLYRDLLGRAAAASEAAYWTGRMASGMGRGDVASAVLSSPEFHGHVVDGDYQLLLGRSPDAAGRAYWTSVLGGGAYNEAVEAGFAGSNEYVAIRGGGTPAGFVQALYHDFLGRTASSAEVGYWTGRLASGMSPVAVATGFAFSHENHADLVGGWYQRYLGRPGDPGGIAYWAAYLDRGGRDETIEAGLLGSAEYLARVSS
jgi:Domain of unknown function (DUF4214)